MNISHHPRIAIVGGGFGGALALANLIEHARLPFSVEWFDAGESPGTGIAYGTKDAAHLLNVRAGRMGAFHDRPEDFFRWLQTPEGDAHARSIWPGHTIAKESYVPRMLYGEYLRHVVRESLAEAQRKGIRVEISRATVTDASLYDPDDQQILLVAREGEKQREILADAVVLATGNLPPRHFSFQHGLIRGKIDYVADVWNTPRNHVFPHNVSELPADSEVVIIGTGLTMADTVLTLKARGFKGVITAISRNGWLPAAHMHSDSYPDWKWAQKPGQAPRTALGLLAGLREEVAKAAAAGFDWRAVIDSLRPVTQTLWKQLSIREKRRFLSKLLTLWNVHRHRMAQDVHAQLKAMQQNGTLKIVAGKIYYVGSDEDGMTVALRRRGTNRMETLRPALVLNCTGPEYDIASSNHTLLRNMRDRGLITVGPLRMGIELTAAGTAQGKAPDAIFPLGSLLVGELLECTAVPELREQAHAVANNVIRRINRLLWPVAKEQVFLRAGI